MERLGLLTLRRKALGTLARLQSFSSYWSSAGTEPSFILIWTASPQLPSPSPFSMDSVKEQVAYIPLQGSDHDEESDAGTLVLSVKPARFRRPRRGLCTLYVTVALLLGLLLGGSTSTGKDTRKVVAAWISRDRTLDNDLDSLYGYDGLGDVADISRWVAGTNATNTFRGKRAHPSAI